jgi:hypothetical protein
MYVYISKAVHRSTFHFVFITSTFVRGTSKSASLRPALLLPEVCATARVSLCPKDN